MEILEIIEDNPDEYIFKKQPPVVIYKKIVLKYLAKFVENPCAKVFLLIKLPQPSNFIKGRLWHRCVL